MSIIAILAFIICPIISLPFVVLGLKKDGKRRMIYLSIIAVFLALFSYHYQPTPSEDLYRHHTDVVSYEGMSTDSLMKDISSQPEQLSIIYKYLISKTGNEDLLQFFIAIMCYIILLYLLNKQTEKHAELAFWKKVGVWFFVLAGFHFLVITSGMFYTLALEIFALAVYFDYSDKKKLLSILCYIVPIFIHTCAALPLVVVLLYKLLGSKMNLKNGIILSASVLSIGFIMTVIAPNFDIPIVNELSKLYVAYFNNEEQWSDLHSPFVLALYLSRLIPVAVGYFLLKKHDNKVSDFSLFMTLLIVLLFFQTSFSIRYIHIAVLCGIPIMFESIKHEKFGTIYSLALYAFAIPHVVYQIHQLSSVGIIKDLKSIPFVSLIVQLLGE